jgi:hypothetical protein
LRVEAREERLSVNGGAVLLREHAERSGLLAWLTQHLRDPRDPSRITHPFRELVSTMVLLFAQGWEDQDDADHLRQDPALRASVSTRRGTGPLLPAPPEARGPGGEPLVPEGLPSQPTLSRMVRSLATPENRVVLRQGLVEAAARRLELEGTPILEHVTVDLDLLPVDVEGGQQGARFHPYYGRKVYLPLVASVAETGDLLDVKLQHGTAHETSSFETLVPALLDQVEGRLCKKASVRMDAGFPCEKTLGLLEARDTRYVCRLRGNPVLQRMAQPYLKRPPGRPPKEPRIWTYEEEYEAETWSKARRVVLVVLERPGELFLDHFWLVTNWTEEEQPGAELLELYRRRGKAEGHMGEWMSTLTPRLSSTHRWKDHYQGREILAPVQLGQPFAQNEVLLVLSALAYSLMHGLRTLVSRERGESWSIRRLRERILRVAARFLIHARTVTVVISTNAARYWRGLLAELERLPRLGAQPV